MIGTTGKGVQIMYKIENCFRLYFDKSAITLIMY